VIGRNVNKSQHIKVIATDSAALKMAIDAARTGSIFRAFDFDAARGRPLMNLAISVAAGRDFAREAAIAARLAPLAVAATEAAAKVPQPQLAPAAVKTLAANGETANAIAAYCPLWRAFAMR
jgi:hypothetical protein